MLVERIRDPAESTRSAVAPRNPARHTRLVGPVPHVLSWPEPQNDQSRPGVEPSPNLDERNPNSIETHIRQNPESWSSTPQSVVEHNPKTAVWTLSLAEPTAKLADPDWSNPTQLWPNLTFVECALCWANSKWTVPIPQLGRRRSDFGLSSTASRTSAELPPPRGAQVSWTTTSRCSSPSSLPCSRSGSCSSSRSGCCPSSNEAWERPGVCSCHMGVRGRKPGVQSGGRSGLGTSRPWTPPTQMSGVKV